MPLGIADFERARQAGLTPEKTASLWPVYDDYRFVTPGNDDEERRFKRESRYVVKCGELGEETKPLESDGLLIELAALWESGRKKDGGERDFETPVIGFVREHGVLGLNPGGLPWRGGESETVVGYVQESRRAWFVVRLYEAVLAGDEELAGDILEKFPRRAPDRLRLDDDGKTYGMDTLETALLEITLATNERVSELCRFVVLPEASSGSPANIKTAWEFDNLLGAAYLQFMWLLESGGGVKRCDYCGLPIANPRKDIRFCRKTDGLKNKCRRDWNYHFGTGKSSKAALKARRESRAGYKNGSNAAAIDNNSQQHAATP